MTHDSLIFLSLEDWDDIWRRNQFVCAALARRHPEMKILFVGIPRHAANLLRAFRFRALFAHPSWTVPGLPNITVTKPLRLGIDSTESGHRLNQRLYRNHIRDLAKTLGMVRPLLWINPHEAFHVPASVEHAAVIYDITDDWTALSQKELDRRRTIEADHALCQSADAVIVCSEKLREMKLPLVAPGRLHLIPNGVDAAHYARVTEPFVASEQVPEALARLVGRGPIFGYTGTIHPDRVDVDMLLQLTKLLPESLFVLIGPSYLSAQQRADLAASDVALLPAVPYQHIPACMRAFDVSITPHKMTLFTESLNPIKLWEYLAAGKPIVSTNVAGFRDYPEHVRIANTTGEFAAALAGALEEARSPDAAPRAAVRQAEARQHSWDARVDQIEAVIEAAQTSPALQRPFP